MKKSVRNSFYVIGQPLLVNLIGLPAFAYVVHRLGRVAFGQMSAATALVAIVSLWGGLGLRPLFVKRVAQHPEDVEQSLGYQMTLRVLLNTGVAIVSILIGAAIRYNTTIQICVIISAACCILSTISSTFLDTLQGLQRLRAYAMINLIAGIVITAFQVLAAWLGQGAIGLSATFLAQPATVLVLSWYALRRQSVHLRLHFDLSVYRELLRDARSIGVAQIATGIRDRVENVLLPKIAGIADFGSFSAATMPMGRLNIIPDGFTTAFFPTIAQAGKNSRVDATPTVVELMISSLVVCIPIAVIITYLAGPISHILFKRQDHPEICTRIMQITAWMLPLRGLQLSMGCALQATGKHKQTSHLGVAATVVSVLITIFMISQYRLMGASLAWIIRPGISVLFLLPLFIGSFPASLPRVPIARILACTLLMGALLWYVSTLWKLHLLGVGVVGCAAVAIYIGGLILLRVLDPSALTEGVRRRLDKLR